MGAEPSSPESGWQVAMLRRGLEWYHLPTLCVVFTESPKIQL